MARGSVFYGSLLGSGGKGVEGLQTHFFKLKKQLRSESEIIYFQVHNIEKGGHCAEEKKLFLGVMVLGVCDRTI